MVPDRTCRRRGCGVGRFVCIRSRAPGPDQSCQPAAGTRAPRIRARPLGRKPCPASPCPALPPLKPAKSALPTAPTPTTLSCFTAWPPTRFQVPGLRFTHTLCDIQTLNQQAMSANGDGVYDVTAISFHAYPYIQDHYAIMPCGGSVGEGYGPMIIAAPRLRAQRNQEQGNCYPRQADHRVSGAEVVRSRNRNRSRALRSDHSPGMAGKYEAGLIIHEGQLTYDQRRPAPHRWTSEVVAANHRPASAPRRQRHPPRASAPS